MKTELMNTSKKYEHVGTFVWHNLTHDVRVSRDYLNYSEHGMPYVVDHFELNVTDVNGNTVKSPLTETVSFVYAGAQIRTLRRYNSL